MRFWLTWAGVKIRPSLSTRTRKPLANNTVNNTRKSRHPSSCSWWGSSVSTSFLLFLVRLVSLDILPPVPGEAGCQVLCLYTTLCTLVLHVHPQCVYVHNRTRNLLCCKVLFCLFICLFVCLFVFSSSFRSNAGSVNLSLLLCSGTSIFLASGSVYACGFDILRWMGRPGTLPRTMQGYSIANVVQCWPWFYNDRFAALQKYVQWIPKKA